MSVESEPAFARQLRRLRQAAGLSQEDLAERAGLTAAAIGALERGERRHPYPHTLQAIADALGLSPGDRAVFFSTVPRRGSSSAGGASDGAPAECSHWTSPPSPLTPLVGRQRDIALVTALFQGGGARLVTLTGPGGVGKTRLAVELAITLGDRLKVGATWADLAPIHDVGLVPSAIARAFALAERAGQSTAEALAGYLHHRHALLVLDNLEHLLPAAPFVSDLLERCPQLRVLATSREALHVRGEHEVQVLPLGLPDAETSGVAGVAYAESADLFLQRVRAVRPGFELADAEAPLVAALCVRLDGIPLALELAAVQLKYMSPALLLERLRSRLAALEGGPRDLPTRQRSLRATLAWSYDLLAAPEQDLFRRLAVFGGGFTREAVQAVCAVEGGPVEEIGGLLASLVDKSVVQTAVGPGGEVRFAMLETIREYARERLCESGEEALLAHRHADYFCHLAEVAEPQLRGPHRTPWLRQLDAETGNIQAALACTAQGDAHTGLRLAGALGWFWILRGHIAEGTHWTDLFLARPAAPGEDEARAGALYAAAAVAWKREEYEAARRHAEESVALWRALGDPRLAFSLAVAGLVATSQGDLECAIRFQEESLSLFRGQGERWGVAYALSNLGDALLQWGDLRAAGQRFREGLEHFEAVGDPWGRGIVHHALGNVALAQGDLAAARAHYGASIPLFRAMENRENVARSLIGLAATVLSAGETDEPRRLLREAISIWRDLGSVAGLALCLAGVAAIEAASGRFRRAALLFGSAETQGRGRPAPYLVSADTFFRHRQEARQHLGEALFAEAWAEGQAMSQEDAIDCALQEGDEHRHEPAT